MLYNHVLELVDAYLQLEMIHVNDQKTLARERCDETVEWGYSCASSELKNLEAFIRDLDDVLADKGE